MDLPSCTEPRPQPHPAPLGGFRCVLDIICSLHAMSDFKSVLHRFYRYTHSSASQKHKINMLRCFPSRGKFSFSLETAHTNKWMEEKHNRHCSPTRLLWRSAVSIYLKQRNSYNLSRYFSFLSQTVSLIFSSNCFTRTTSFYPDPVRQAFLGEGERRPPPPLDSETCFLTRRYTER